MPLVMVSPFRSVALPEMNAAAENMAHLIVGRQSDPVALSLGGHIAEAQIDLTRVRQARHEHLRRFVEEPING